MKSSMEEQKLEFSKMIEVNKQEILDAQKNLFQEYGETENREVHEEEELDRFDYHTKSVILRTERQPRRSRNKLRRWKLSKYLKKTKLVDLGRIKMYCLCSEMEKILSNKTNGFRDLCKEANRT